jgi:flagellar basal-body rod protein FlgC
MKKQTVILLLFSTFLYSPILGQTRSNPIQSMSLDTAMDASTSGMIAQRIRMAVIAENVANLTTFKVEETGQPYQKKIVVMEPFRGGVRVKAIERSEEPFLSYPDANTPLSEGGYIHLPNVSIPDEMLNMSYTEVMYEANSTALKTAKAMYQSVIDTLK